MFSSLKAHYLFDSDFCNPASGNEKGTVENLVKFVRLNTLVPVPSFNTLDELNNHLLAWCEQERLRRLSEWEQEQTGLMPLPSTPFKCAVTHMVSTSSLLLFQFDRNHYSVPAGYGNRDLRIEAFTDKIEIYDSTKLIAMHKRCYKRGEKIMHLQHYLPILARKPRASTNALVVRKLPEVYQQLRVSLCRQNPEGYREFTKILLLNQEFSFEAVLNAVEEAMRQGIASLSTIRCLLDSRLNTTSNKTSTVLPLKGPEVPLDSPSKYDHLMRGVTA